MGTSINTDNGQVILWTTELKNILVVFACMIQMLVMKLKFKPFLNIEMMDFYHILYCRGHHPSFIDT